MKFMVIRKNVTCDGEGLRTSVYFSGCQLALEGKACLGCHNSIAWDKNVGDEWTEDTKKVVLDSLEPTYVDGLSILGGEPLSDFNLDGVIDLAKSVKERFSNKTVWVWTGYVLDDVMNLKPKVAELLKYVDYIVDGPFMKDLKEPDLRFRGSMNQRILKINNGEIIDTTNQM